MSYLDFDFPHTSMYTTDLREILKKVFELNNDVKNFVSVNAVKYANPIQWNITKQYEKNTIVIDPLTGTAYISVDSVPSGVALTREEFWTPVFDLGQFVVRASKNFSERYEQETTLTATFSTAAGEWLVWGDTLYVANVNITPGDSYVVNGNIRHITIEEVKNTISEMIGDLNGLATTVKNNLVVAINELVSTLSVERQARQDGDGALSDRIDNEVQARQDADSALSVRIDNEVQARQDADSALSDRINNEAQARQDADSALSDRIDNLAHYDMADIRRYGGVADGVTDCTNAFNACMAENNVVYLPNYNNSAYRLGAVTLHSGQSIVGDEGTHISTTATDFITIVGNNVEVKNLIVMTSNNVIYIDSSDNFLSFIHIENVYSYGANIFIHDNSSASNTYTNLYIDRCAARQHKTYGIDLAKGLAFIFMNNVTIDFVGVVASQPAFRIRNNAGCHLVRCEAEGGYSDGSHISNTGFSFIDCQAIWLERCMGDTLDGSAFNFFNCQYVYMNSCVASLMGAHGIAILSTTSRHFLITNCYIGGRKGQGSSVPGAHGIYNYNDYVQLSNVDITNMTGYGISNNGTGDHNQYKGINISNCDRSFVSSAGSGIVSDMISSVADVPTFGNYKHRMVVANNVLYDTPLGA